MYVVTIVFAAAIVLSWYLYIGTEEELQEFSFNLFMSFVWIGGGFVIYITFIPERFFLKSRFVQLAL